MAGSEESNRRLLRLEKEIREVVGTYLISGFRGEIRGLVSVSRVQVSRDLRWAKIFVSFMGSDEDRDHSLNELEHFTRDVQTELNRKLRLKFTPKVSFHLDTGLEKTLKVEKILRDLEVDRVSAGESGRKPRNGDGDE